MALIFDGPNKKIQFDKTDNNHRVILYGKVWYTIDAVELYSEWKRWCVLSDGAQYTPAFNVIGGEDIGSGLKVGSYVFLLVSNGWVLLSPDEDEVTIQITGNLYPDIANYPVIERFESNQFVLIMRNSSLTQTSVVSTGSGLSEEQDSLLRDIAPKLSKINDGVKKSSILVPHTENV